MSHIDVSKVCEPMVSRSRSNAPTSSKRVHVASGCSLPNFSTTSHQRSYNATDWTCMASWGGSPGETPRLSKRPSFTITVMIGQSMLKMGISKKAGTPETRKCRAPALYKLSKDSEIISASRAPGFAERISGVIDPPVCKPRPPIRASAHFIMKSLPPVWITTSVSCLNNPSDVLGSCMLASARRPWFARSLHIEPAVAKLYTRADSLRPSICGQVGCM
mmetsp:Transcript_31528/g.61936  ORF Transcript_31528/g.61936 Transcript_31528/m.61936 type:complete len:219 (-) Transcript_31528:157-813(-)